MSWYVKINRLNGRFDLPWLWEWLERSGVKEVDYNDGGWQDRSMNLCHPHLKFENEEDAIAFVLANGGEISNTIPEKIRNLKEN